MKKFFLSVMLGMLLFSANATVTAYFNYGVFNVPAQSPFLETYLTVVGNTVRHKAVSGGYQGSVNIKVSILQGALTLKNYNYNLIGPLDKDSSGNSSFIDNQRYSLPNGNYVFEITITDNNDPDKKSFTYKENVSIDFSALQLQSSSIQPLESYQRISKPSGISKSGFELIPYNINYYPDDQKRLMFYFEAYNADTVIGKNKPFLFSYYIQRKENLQKMDGYLGFKKNNANKVNPLLAQLDITNLESGNYYLVIEVRDQNNKLHLEKKWLFQRKSSVYNKITFKQKRNSYEFFGDYKNVDTLKMFVECLWPVSNSVERDWEINQSIKKDPELMKNFVVDFWQKRAGDSLDPLQMWLKYYTKVVEVNKMFKCGKQKGYFTDRGRVCLQYGLPNQRSQRPNEPNSYPYEIWQYYRLQDGATGQFYSNKKFVFVNRAIADDCYTLIHSDLRGEPSNDKWLYEIEKRAANKGQLDDTTPQSTYGSQASDIFNNPR